MPRPSISRLAALVLLGLSGCAAPRPPDSGIELELSAVEIPAGSAHTVFQGGRQVGGASTLEPYFNCRIGGPLTPEQIQAVVGPVMRMTLASTGTPT
jgi:hypothetical protein